MAPSWHRHPEGYAMGTRKTASRKSASPSAAQNTVKRQRKLQNEIDRKDVASKKKSPKKAMQAGVRTQPVHMPAQHLRKPGTEADLALAPAFEAPDYRGSGKLEGLTAIVTGADSGIGRAVAVLFAREGANVAVLYLNEHVDARETARWIEKEGRNALLIPGDVRDSAFCKRAADKVAKQFGGIDVLVNNAGFQLHAERLEDLTDEHLQETLQTNVAGYIHMARACLPHMERGASIVNCGSVTGLFGSPQLIDYSATKGAVHAFTKALAANLLERGIRVNAVAPGPVWTPFNPADKPADEVAAFGKDSAMGRPAQPEELSPAFVFLASPVMSSYVNGIVLPVMGGPKG
ncbi:MULTISPECIES: SDR family oxidoreductase [unclassified Pseudoxanthomonas]|uniref:SDR family oxidoreductase n=1 Tax=unclassified Pseudoxanthomonas TaxID=2645906 RepID=UPI000B88FA3B|nr:MULTISPECIES: SDR family oxidoreductase [unclassified Pseudoxanthomonas]PPJ41298.1 KR domain-containing protein [Pseudoxanthomonas sp. KAs_5_3]